MALTLIDIKDVLKTFEHHAHAQMFLTELKNGIIARTVKAIPGKMQTLRIGTAPLEYQSMVIMDTPEFTAWLEQTRKTITETRYNDSKVATVRSYEQLDESMFELFAAQAAEDMRLTQEQEKTKQGQEKDKGKAAQAEDSAETQMPKHAAESSQETDQAV